MVREIAVLVAAAAGVQAAPRVIVVGVDGLSARGLDAAKKPNIAGLMSHGAWTLHARAVLPTVSSPNWA